MEVEKKKCVLPKDEVSHWLQIWIAVSSLDVKVQSNKKSTFFLTRCLVLAKMVTYTIVVLLGFKIW